mmetsp:Transcript_62705/g.148510  ORF Transcript_62705/g.148510 Transcript_62705/m.148510 type:complete len:94 (+) Transcript_62705:319-600(+)
MESEVRSKQILKSRHYAQRFEAGLDRRGRHLNLLEFGVWTDPRTSSLPHLVASAVLHKSYKKQTCNGKTLCPVFTLGCAVPLEKTDSWSGGLS